MKKQTINYWSTIQLRGIIVTGGIIIILFLSLKFSQAQLVQDSIEFEGPYRNYYVFLPQNYQPNMPVVFNLHGYTYDAQMQMNYSQMNEVADTAGFIVVYPDAIQPGFNGGVWIPDPPLDTTINDVGFISALIDTINVHYDIDTNRVYCCGLSNGGQMTYRLTCQLGHRFAAVASVSGLVSDNSTAGCLSYPPIPILHMHGTADNIVPYNGTIYQWGVEETLNYWLEKNGCSLPGDTVFLPDIDPTDGCTVQKISYTNCEDYSSLIFYKVIGGGHSWPGADTSYWWSDPTNQDIHASVEIWNFFKDYPPIHCLPEGITFTAQQEIDSFQINYPNCTEIEGDVTINGDDITNLNGLGDLISIGGSLLIGSLTGPMLYNPSLVNLEGLENLTSLGEYLYIVGNLSLFSLSGLDNLAFAEGLTICGNEVLTDLTSLGNITSVPSSVVIGGFPLGGNPSLTSLTGLDNLVLIGEDLFIGENDILTSLQDLYKLTFTGGDIHISDNHSLTNLTGLDSITSILGDLAIASNESIISLEGIGNVSSIGGSIKILYNPSLVDLTDLLNITSVSGDILVQYNDILTSLTGLENIDETSIANLTITNNNELYDCDIWPICQYLKQPGGTVVIEYNAPECNSIEEVEEHCLTGIEEYVSKEELNIYPNPLGSNVTITYNLKQSSHVTLKILDLSGSEMSTLINEVQKQGEQKFKYNSHGLKPGVYFCVLKTNEGMQTKKMIKL